MAWWEWFATIVLCLSDFEADFRQVGAEGMQIEDGSIDVVLSTLVLCSVADSQVVDRDIHRVLKPGGRFVFLEHVAAPRGSGLRRLQRGFITWHVEMS